MEDGGESEAELDTRELVQKQNKKNKKSGGFQSMGLSYPVFKGIIKKGYKVPTPIQRKCIPLILEGRDVVAMARTGSGKTAAFLIPMFERLRTHAAKTGARAMILSPTRELALQTLKFTRELGKFTGLKSVCVLGGDKMDNQFAAIHENPDIIIATPGRFLHILIEMDLKLSSVEYVVFDEADRLFELGFHEQLQETLRRLPDARQTVLFSATLPRLLVDFAKAGLTDPVLVRLDVETKLSEQLKLAFIGCRPKDKIPALLYLLQRVIKPEEMTVVFIATKHHVEYLNLILEQAGIACTYIYSSLDQTARKINVTKFQKKRVKVLLVTDVAARGIDIPMLDNVINFNIPAKAKLFVHRVGRVARAGRTGTAYSLVAPDEEAFVLDLHLFLGRPMRYISNETSNWDGQYGVVPRFLLDDYENQLEAWHENIAELRDMQKVCVNAYKQYVKSRPQPSAESVKRMKDARLSKASIGVHPIFEISDQKAPTARDERAKLLSEIKHFRPNATIFEINATSKTSAAEIMRKTRQLHEQAVEKHREKMRKLEEERNVSSETTKIRADEVQDNEKQLEDVFGSIITSKKSNTAKPFVPRKKLKVRRCTYKDEAHYVPYRRSDEHTERGLELESSTFDRQASGAVLDLTGDDDKQLRRSQNQLRWDRKRKRFTQESEGGKDAKKIRTESGVWIPASYKSDMYKQWKQKYKTDHNQENEPDTESNERRTPKKWGRKGGNKNPQELQRGLATKPHRKGPRRELKNKEEILKARRVKAKKHSLQIRKNKKGRNRQQRGKRRK